MIPTVFGTVGVPVRLEGYAQDFGSGVARVEFSCDGGETWTGYPIEGASQDANINWQFEFEAPEAGNYELLVRSVRADGTPTPEPAHAYLTISNATELVE